MPNLFDTGASPSDMWDSQALLRPSLDIEETADSYQLSVELPGVSKQDLKLNLNGQVLTISGEKKQQSEEQEKGKYHRIERRYGSFSRTLTLPDDIDSNSIEANFNDGVLRISIKRAKDKSTASSQIPIK